MPVLNGINAESFFGTPFVSIMNLKSVSFIGKKTPKSELIWIMMTTALKTWPLIIVAMSMTICAGTLIWILVS